nr:hypothetical protein [Tanacetum cinerariifolium]
MVAILEKTEHNTDFHQIVDFLEASHIRYALTISSTVYVSHSRQFWSTARIETTNQETKILATVDGKPRTISESSLRRHLKLNDEEGISSLPDAELFENLSLMGYNILPNQRFTFQKALLHQWNFLTHTIMQCLSPKSTGFNEFSSNIATTVGEGLANPTEPQEQHSPHHDSPPPSPQTIISDPLPQAPTVTLTLRRYTRRDIQIAQSKALSSAADEPASLSRDDRQREAFPIVSSLNARQDKENIAKTSALPYESSPRVTSLDADKGSTQQRIHELMELCTSLQRQQSQMTAKIKDQDLEISGLKVRVKSLEDKERRSVEPTQEDALITGGIIEIGEQFKADKSTELGSNDTEEMVNVLSSMEAVNILTSGGAAASISFADVLSAAGVPTVSGSFPTASVILPLPVCAKEKKTSRTDRCSGSQEIEEEFARENQRVSEQLARDSNIARLHAKEELKMMIKGLDRNNEVIAKHLREYKQAAADLSVGEKLELINWEIHSEGKREYWKIIRLGGHTAVYQFFVDMLKQFDREDLHQLWTLVKETFSIRHATKDKEKELWKLYDTCGAHHVFTKDQEIFMLVEKDYPLRRGLATVMISEHLILELDWRCSIKFRGGLLGIKCSKAFPLLVMMIPLLVHFATVSTKESLLGHILYRTPWPIKGVLRATKNLNWLWLKRLAHLNIKTINQLAKQNLVMGLPSLVYSKDKPCSSCEEGNHHRASFKSKQTFSIKKCLHFLHMDLFRLVTPRSINHEKYTLVIVDEYSRRIQNINFLYVFRCLVYIHKHKDYLGKFDEKADDGYFLGYSLVSKAFRSFNTRKQETKETYHITFDESTDAIKFLKPSIDNINIAKSERYPPDEYIHHYEPSQKYQENNIPNENPPEHSNHNNDSPIIENLINAEVVQDFEPTSSLDKHIELVNIIGDPGAGMLTRAMAKTLSAALAHECLFVDFLSGEEPKMVSEALKHPGWIDAMQD